MEAKEKEAVLTYFKINIRNSIVPGKVDCMKCIEAHPLLEQRDWKKIKYAVKNIIDKNKKLKKKHTV
ncbi:unnamed protein product [Acanthoscelides obtectus]|uniref:Uncharacterized protein n=1 Tax=Acanthoscelides obtectus TaxID=200917 RepID=A0A9P0PXY6_ACAOB|nr:unnamed protein product [Acanthoscelides obtectus]CAK1680540.1 hypothetical protein AOBTE_LOCUS32741 [Acanthoscelides obtectus]